MRMKPVDPAATIRDPFTKLSLSPEGEDVPESGDRGVHWTRRWLAGETWRQEGNEWVRRMPSGEIERIPVPAEPVTAEPARASTPVLNVPVTPLVTR